MTWFGNGQNETGRVLRAGARQSALERAVRDRLDVLWGSGTQRSRDETAGFLLAEIDPILQRWIDEEGR